MEEERPGGPEVGTLARHWSEHPDWSTVIVTVSVAVVAAASVTVSVAVYAASAR